MAEFIYDRESMTVVVLRVPKSVWDRWEYKHQHYGKAIHALRESCIEIMAAKVVGDYRADQVDPFFHLEPRGE